jgi:hypothetical protein
VGPVRARGRDRTAEVDKVKDKSKKRSKEDKVWPAQAVKIESVVNCAYVLVLGREALTLTGIGCDWCIAKGAPLAVHKGIKSNQSPPTAAPLLRRAPSIQTHMLFGARTVARKS